MVDALKKGRLATRVEALETLTVFAGVCLVLGLVSDRRAYFWMALLFLGIALVAKPLAALLARIWLQFAELLARINNRLLLTLLFYGLLTPLAFVYRLCKHDPLHLTGKRSPSFFNERDHRYAADDLKRMW